MVAIVRSRPNIKVRELARELGFAEDRLVYYWIRKSGHSGIKSFKDAVLSGRIGGDAPEEPLPLHVKEAEGGTTTTVTSWEYAPLLMPGDELRVDRSRPPVDGDLVMVKLKGEEGAIRRYLVGNPALLVHPIRTYETVRVGKGGTYANASDIIMGTVICVTRRRP